MQSAPASWSALGSSPSSTIPSTTEPTGWIVRIIDVSAAGRRGSETEISSQPSTCEVSARQISHAADGHAGTRSSDAERERGGERRDRGHPGRVEQRPGGPPQVLVAVAQDQDEARVGDARQRAEQHAARAGARRTRRPPARPRSARRRSASAAARRGSAAPAPRPAPPRRRTGRSRPAGSRARSRGPAPTSAIAWCQKIRSAAKNRPAISASRCWPGRARPVAAPLAPREQPEHRHGVGAAVDRRRRRVHVGLVDEDRRERDRQRAGERDQRRAADRRGARAAPSAATAVMPRGASRSTRCRCGGTRAARTCARRASSAAERNTTSAPRSRACSTSRPVTAAPMPRRRADGSVPTPVTSVTSPDELVRAGAERAVRGALGDRHRGQPAAQPLAQEAEVGRARAAARSRASGPRRAERRALGRERELDRRLRARQRAVVGAEHAHGDARRARAAAPTRPASSASSGTCRTSSPAAAAAPASDGVVSCTHSNASRTPSSRWRARTAATSSAPTSSPSPSRGPPVEAPRDARDEQRQRAVLLDVGGRARRGVVVRLDPPQQVGVRADRAHRRRRSGRDPAQVQRGVERRLVDAVLARDLAQRAAARRRVLDDLGGLVVADERVERGGDGERALGRGLAAGEVRLDAVDALLREQLARGREQRDRLQQVARDQRDPHVQLELALEAADGDRRVVADHLRADLQHDLRDHRVDLARHDRGALLQLGQEQLADAGARAGAHHRQVVGDLGQRDRDRPSARPTARRARRGCPAPRTGPRARARRARGRRRAARAPSRRTRGAC